MRVSARCECLYVKGVWTVLSPEFVSPNSQQQWETCCNSTVKEQTKKEFKREREMKSRRTEGEDKEENTLCEGERWTLPATNKKNAKQQKKTNKRADQANIKKSTLRHNLMHTQDTENCVKQHSRTETHNNTKQNILRTKHTQAPTNRTCGSVALRTSSSRTH